LYRHRKLNPSSPPFTKGRNYPSLAKRGEGRFSNQYVYSIMDSLVIDREILKTRGPIGRAVRLADKVNQRLRDEKERTDGAEKKKLFVTL